MTNSDSHNLEKQISVLNSKVDNMYHKIDLICSDLNVNHGTKVSVQLAEIMNYLKSVSKNISDGQVSSIRFKIDDVVRNIEYINHKITNI